MCINFKEILAENFDFVLLFEKTIKEKSKEIILQFTPKYGSICKKCNGKTHEEIIGSHMERDSGWDESGSPSAYSHEVSDYGDVPDSCDNCIKGFEYYVLGSRRDLEVEWFKNFIVEQFDYKFYFFSKNRKRDIENVIKKIDKQLC